MSILVKLLNPIVWSIPGHAARKLYSFSLAEHGSMLDLKLAARLTPSPQRRAAYVRHLLDETRHAQMFSRRSAELRREAGKPSLGHPRADTEDLFRMLGEVRFLAFVHRGEARGRKQFETYRDWFGRRGDEKSRKLFTAIEKDEAMHESYTWDLLVEMTGSVDAARKELRKAAMWEAWRTWRRAGRALTERAYFLIMVAIYMMLVPLTTLLVALVRRQRTGWALPSTEARGGRAPALLPAPALATTSGAPLGSTSIERAS
jgi:hypothetical protein